jgi:hypothetical protein
VDGGGGRPGFSRALKAALAGDTHARFVHIGNFEVEREWAAGEIGLPRTSFGGPSSIVHRMDELALLVAEPEDVIVLKAPPDPAYLDYLGSIGLAASTIVTGSRPDPDATVTRDALAAPEVLGALARIATETGGYLLPHGTSELEERLAERTGLVLATAPASVARTVNSKVYSRRLAAELGLRQAAGWACERLDELEAALTGARRLLAAGHRVGVKDAFGVSGKGIVVVDDPRRLDQVHRLVAAQAHRAGTDRIALVVEEWVPTRGDLSYQFTVGADGEVRFDRVAEAVISGGVHRGNRMPVTLSPEIEPLRAVAEAIGARLAKDGYRGVVGVDAMVDPDGGVYPVNEINARSVMLTYLASLADRVFADAALISRLHPLRLIAPLAFERLFDVLRGLLWTPSGDAGVVVTAFAPVNADAPAPGSARAGEPFAGRLATVVAAPSLERAGEIEAEVAARLSTLEARHGR